MTNYRLNPYRRSALRVSLVEWMSKDLFTHAVTLNPNRGMLTKGSLGEIFSRFCHEVDRVKLGKCRVYRAPTADRLQAIAMPEHLETNAHLHIVADLSFLDARGCDAEGICSAVDLAWRRATKGSGSIDVQRLSGNGWPWYITKEFSAVDQSYFLASDYHPH